MIEDDLDLGCALLRALKSDGVSAQWLRRASDAPWPFETEAIDCVLLDGSLPVGPYQ
jgi:two-component system response regulator QseB